MRTKDRSIVKRASFINDHVKTFALLLLLLLCIVSFSALSVDRNKSEVWFSNIDQDGTLLIDTLRANSGSIPEEFGHPSHGTYLIYGKSLELLEMAGILSASQFGQLKISDDPLMLLPDIFYKARWISIFLCMLCGLTFGSIFFVLTRNFTFFVLGVFLLLSSGGIFLHSLFERSELPSVLFVLLSFLFIVLEYKSDKKWLNRVYMLISGISIGFALLSKVQAIPALLIVIICILLGIIDKENPKSQKFSGGDIAFVTIIFLFVWKFAEEFIDAVSKTGHSSPPLFWLIAALITAGGIVTCIPRVHNFKAFVFSSKLALLLVGLLLSFWISFYCLNYGLPGEGDKLWKGHIYHRVLNPSYSVEQFGGAAKKGVTAIYTNFREFMRYYGYESPHFLLIGALIVMAFYFTRELPRPLTISMLLGGLLFCFVSSMRYFSPQYLIYSDVFFAGGIMLLIIQCYDFSQPRFFVKNRKRILPILYMFLLLICCGMFYKQYPFISKRYGTWAGDSKDRADWVYWMMSGQDGPGSEYRRMMLKKYKSRDDITRRVCNDPYLNGEMRGIILRDKPNAKRFYSQYLEDLHWSD